MTYEAAKDPELVEALREYAEAYGHHEAMVTGRISGRTDPSIRQRQRIVTEFNRTRTRLHAYIERLANGG